MRAGTTAMVNMWAITRDPKVWEDPLYFAPKRLVDRDDAEPEFSIFESDGWLASFGGAGGSALGRPWA